MKEIEISSKEKFAIQITKMCREENIDIIDAIVAFGERNSVNMEDIIPLLDNAMKEEIKAQAIEGRYVTGFKTNKLKL